MKPHRGTLILILGILSLVLCGIFTGIPAWVMGSSDLKEMDAGTMNPEGRGVTNAGKICGMVSVVLLGVSLIIGVIVVAMGFLAHSSQ
jgi:hypothetical protein